MGAEPTLHLALYDIGVPGSTHLLNERANLKPRSRPAIRKADPNVAA